MSQVGLDCLVLKTDTLRAEILPALGGKVASLRSNGLELLHPPIRDYAVRTAQMGFEESDASGFDECLPTVAGCVLPDGTEIPDHGEFWRLPCRVESAGERQAKLLAEGRVLPLRFERTLRLEANTLRIEYRLENVGETDVPYLWAAHPLLIVEAGDRIVLPPSIHQVVPESSLSGRLQPGRELSWPLAERADGGSEDISRAHGPETGIGDKLFTASPVEGWAALDRQRAGLRIKVGFDPALTPSLGLWLCYGGWPPHQATRQQCVGLEPCTAPGDSLAQAVEAGTARVLAAGQSTSWWMTITVSERTQ